MRSFHAIHPFRASLASGSGSGVWAIRLAWRFMAVWCLTFLSALPVKGGSISLSGLTHTFNGSPKSATVTTVPAGLPFTITYGGSTSAPTNAGSYAVVATLQDELSVSATGTLVINKASASISFPALTDKNYGDPPFTISATVNPTASGLTANLTSSDPAVATVSGNTVTVIGAGTATITARQSGSNANYNTAPDANRTLTVNGLPQVVTFVTTIPVGKKYGDGPFTVGATANTGLPITYRSSDPSVATVAGNVVSIVGAGQCSILAVQAGNSTYAETTVARPLFVQPANLPMPPVALSRTFDGAPKGIDTATLPGGAAAQIRYRSTAQPEPAPAPQVVFQNGPNTLANSYSSIGLQVNRYGALGKSIKLAGSARKLHSCDVTLVTWAQYNTVQNYGYLNWATNNPSLVVAPPDLNNMTPGNTGGWYHPITLTFYDYNDEAQTWRCLAENTVTAFIPWRPMKLANGSAYTSNGYAFRVPFSFPDGVILPDNVFVAVSFNTNSIGSPPIALPGPYDALNLANAGSVTTGTDSFPGFIFYHQNWDWFSASSSGGPMLRLWTVPTTASITPPTAIGTYEVRTVLTGKGVSGEATTALTIGKAPATVTLGNLTATYNGEPKEATATTTPEGLAVTITYNGSATAPSAVGSYTVVATVNDAIYEGTATGTLVINKSPATVTLGNLAATYDGSPKPVTATTTPGGLAVTFTYNGSTTAPTSAGSYEVVATVNDMNHEGTATGTLVIDKATATVTLGNLAATYDGSPKPVTATTTPGGLAVTFTYNGSATAPSAAGNHAVVATINDANYEGMATGTLVIGYDFAGWKAREIAEGRLPAGQSGDSDDPDKDGVTNLQEYAFGLNPGVPDSAPGHPPQLSLAAPNLTFTYRRNLQAVDLTFGIEGTPNLANPSSWSPVVPISEIPVSDDGTTRIIQATLPKPSDPRYFLRLKVGR
ncbi:MAG: MBG domain-containing protein [Verrucomicrobiales bacterium]